MSTQLEEHPDHWVVSTVVAEGHRRKLSRMRVRVGKSEPGAVKAEIIKQAEAARRLLGADQGVQEPVV